MSAEPAIGQTVLVRSRSLVSRCAAVLETGAPAWSVPSLLAAGYALAARRHCAARLDLPLSADVIGVGGAVLGGAGKTPVAIALAARLRLLGASVSFVSHGYSASTLDARRVSARDPVGSVGDDALVASQALWPMNIPVWVARSRTQAIHAAALAQPGPIVVDGLLQARPVPVSRSILVLDAERPWGAASCPPAGDLRAPIPTLLSACDEVVLVADPLAPTAEPPAQLGRLPLRRAWIEISGASDREKLDITIAQLRSARVGLLTFIARPDRVRSSLQRRGVFLACHWIGPDHRSPDARDLVAIRGLAKTFRLDAWLMTPKCATHLLDTDTGAPRWTLDVRTRLDP